MVSPCQGVETIAQHETLYAENCSELPGFLFSRPVQRDDVAGVIGAFFDEVPLVG